MRIDSSFVHFSQMVLVGSVRKRVLGEHSVLSFVSLFCCGFRRPYGLSFSSRSLFPGVLTRGSVTSSFCVYRLDIPRAR